MPPPSLLRPLLSYWSQGATGGQCSALAGSSESAANHEEDGRSRLHYHLRLCFRIYLHCRLRLCLNSAATTEADLNAQIAATEADLNAQMATTEADLNVQMAATEAAAAATKSDLNARSGQPPSRPSVRSGRTLSRPRRMLT